MWNWFLSIVPWIIGIALVVVVWNALSGATT